MRRIAIAIAAAIASLGLAARATVVPGPVLKTIAQQTADLVFIDPPYELEREYLAVLEELSKAPPALTVVQHSVRFALPEAVGTLRRTRIVRQGDNALSFYSVADLGE